MVANVDTYNIQNLPATRDPVHSLLSAVQGATRNRNTGNVQQLPNAPAGLAPHASFLPNAPAGASMGTATPQPFDLNATTTPAGDYGSSMAKLQGISQGQQDLTAQHNAAVQAAALARLQAANSQVPVAGAAGGTPTGVPYHGPTGSHQVQGWIDEALHILGLGQRFEPGIANMIMHESGGDPNAINRTDSNAIAGHPSQGLMQTIPGTFQAYALPGYNKNIVDPVSNIIAGIRYAMSRYGKHMLLEGGRHDSAGNYEGY
jgi:hypothetical protein